MPTRTEIEARLTEALQRAMERFRVAAEQFRAAMAEEVLPHPDGSQLLRNAGAEKRRALRELNDALRRHDAFILYGQLPEDLRDPEDQGGGC